MGKSVVGSRSAATKAALAFVLLATLAACGGSPEPEKKDSPTPSVEETSRFIEEALERTYRDYYAEGAAWKSKTAVQDASVAGGEFSWVETRHTESDVGPLNLRMMLSVPLSELSSQVKVGRQGKNLWRVLMMTREGRKAIRGTTVDLDKKAAGGHAVEYDSYNEWAFYFDEEELARKLARALEHATRIGSQERKPDLF